jgi:hypothetical protein
LIRTEKVPFDIFERHFFCDFESVNFHYKVEWGGSFLSDNRYLCNGKQLKASLLEET